MSDVIWSTDTSILMNAGLQSNTMNIDVTLVEDGFANIAIDNIYGVIHGYNFYAGPYEVTPKADRQELETLNQVMLDDVIVNGIPYYETSNESGGYTVIIGE